MVAREQSSVASQLSQLIALVDEGANVSLGLGAVGSVVLVSQSILEVSVNQSPLSGRTLSRTCGDSVDCIDVFDQGVALDVLLLACEVKLSQFHSLAQISVGVYSLVGRVGVGTVHCLSSASDCAPLSDYDAALRRITIVYIVDEVVIGIVVNRSSVNLDVISQVNLGLSVDELVVIKASLVCCNITSCITVLGKLNVELRVGLDRDLSGVLLINRSAPCPSVRIYSVAGLNNIPSVSTCCNAGKLHINVAGVLVALTVMNLISAEQCNNCLVQFLSVSGLVIVNQSAVVLIEQGLYVSLCSSVGVVSLKAVQNGCSSNASLVSVNDVGLSGLVYRLDLIELAVCVVDTSLKGSNVLINSAVCNGLILVAPVSPASIECANSPSVISEFLGKCSLISLQSSSELSLCNYIQGREALLSSVQLLVSVGDDSAVCGVQNGLSLFVSFLESGEGVSSVDSVAEILVVDVVGLVNRLRGVNDSLQFFNGVDLELVVNSLNHCISSGVVVNSRLGVIENVLCILICVQEVLTGNGTVVVDLGGEESVKAVNISLQIISVLNLCSSCCCSFCASYNGNRADSHYRSHSRSKNSSS